VPRRGHRAIGLRAVTRRGVLRSARRLLVVLAGVCGLLTASSGAAQAMITWNHSEPLQRR
jgi:hypothetical protein